jgi:hypothetical protein
VRRGLAVLTIPLAALLLAVPAVAGHKLVLDTASISAAQCTANGVNARQLVDVSYTLTNYADSGYVGAWALDTVNRHLRIWKQQGGTYCAQIADDGSSFVTLQGLGPIGGTLPAGIKGTFDGGYIIAAINGKFSPGYKTSGNLGTFDAKCNAELDCSGTYPEWTSYFSGLKGGGFAGWGWLYDAGSHGSWLDQSNVSPPHGGNIT